MHMADASARARVCNNDPCHYLPRMPLGSAVRCRYLLFAEKVATTHCSYALHSPPTPRKLAPHTGSVHCTSYPRPESCNHAGTHCTSYLRKESRNSLLVRTALATHAKKAAAHCYCPSHPPSTAKKAATHAGDVFQSPKCIGFAMRFVTAT